MAIRFTSPNQPPPPQPIHIILASQSVGRRTLLEKLGLRFRVAVARIDEEAIVDRDPVVMLRKRAAAKLSEIIDHPRVYAINDEAKTVVIAADSMAILGKKTFGKSRDRNHTKEILRALMDRTHTFVTAVAIAVMDAGIIKKKWDKVEKTNVTLRKLNAVELEQYVARYDFTRFAAGYALTDTPWDLVTKVDGSYTNVVGLPFEALLPVLRHVKIIE
ncbi:septum formation protein Maf [Candidatus Gottesmanbacteria bacterium RIFCSPLOWO2_01_FULL_46_21]|uniref:Nucleoside triphosphate pyrophosphatase n=1 Tax=Candidatus Gottesmanbacteria bacterium RIFCSPLOWO2_01_FULL_46_21 TaxID=1798393 RepID=A0A1F6AXW1_9BACT|nr:MAG: septum formation protein Maf [Candidatus Gottesmanbacteria bacterium RIFCSPLOWO2_01_FULL_46_21]